MGYWFKPLRFFRWCACYYPVSRRGWAVTLMLLGVAGFIFSYVDSRSHSMSDTLIGFAPWAIGMLAVFDVICLKKGEYPSWWKKRISVRRRIRKRFIDMKKLLDPWSVPHFLFGVVTALGAIVFSFPALGMFSATLAAALLWEWLEQYFRLSEAPGNAWMDVLLPLIAFTVTFSLVSLTSVNGEHARSFFAVSVLLYIFTNFFAWRARFEHDRDFQG